MLIFLRPNSSQIVSNSSIASLMPFPTWRALSIFFSKKSFANLTPNFQIKIELPSENTIVQMILFSFQLTTLKYFKAKLMKKKSQQRITVEKYSSSMKINRSNRFAMENKPRQPVTSIDSYWTLNIFYVKIVRLFLNFFHHCLLDEKYSCPFYMKWALNFWIFFHAMICWWFFLNFLVEYLVSNLLVCLRSAMIYQTESRELNFSLIQLLFVAGVEAESASSRLP